ncbi:hypothetical protein NDU88_009695 [Pleurodeles waltl]|uniref:Uncharacterized protein n=1 Tax=Pleurodeles waltl TaxID=8319 RepID=A0AAV7S0F3_PLEWA|nr:hypothetical protein NDU88_009695 [Pleurodeles waltl]
MSAIRVSAVAPAGEKWRQQDPKNSNINQGIFSNREEYARSTYLENQSHTQQKRLKDVTQKQKRKTQEAKRRDIKRKEGQQEHSPRRGGDTLERRHDEDTKEKGGKKTPEMGRTRTPEGMKTRREILLRLERRNRNGLRRSVGATSETLTRPATGQESCGHGCEWL